MEEITEEFEKIESELISLRKKLKETEEEISMKEKENEKTAQLTKFISKIYDFDLIVNIIELSFGSVERFINGYIGENTSNWCPSCGSFMDYDDKCDEEGHRWMRQFINLNNYMTMKET